MIRFLGKLLYPDLPPWQRDVHTRVTLMIAAVVLVLAVAAVIGVIIHFKT